MRVNFGLFCSFSPKLPRIHVRLHRNANEKINRINNIPQHEALKNKPHKLCSFSPESRT